MGRLDTTIKTSVSSSGGRLPKKVQPTVQPIPATNPYFYAKTDTQGGAIGYSQNEYDTSGKPYFAYRNPRDTATTTDRTRVSTTFDPRVATTTPSNSFYNPRESELRNKVSGQLDTQKNEQVDHITSLALSGSNNIDNLRNWDAQKNLKSAPKVRELQSNVSTGRLPLFNAQVEEAKSKSSLFNKVPEPWVPQEQIQKTPFDSTKLGILKNTITGLPKATLDTLQGGGQASFRGFGAIGAKLASGDINAQFTPKGNFPKELYGTDKPVDFTSVGKEVTIKDIPILTPLVGGFLAGADVVSGGSASKASKEVVKLVRASGLSIKTVVNQIKNLGSVKLAEEAVDTFIILKNIDIAKGGRFNMDVIEIIDDYFTKFNKGIVSKDDIRTAQEVHYLMKGDRGVIQPSTLTDRYNRKPILEKPKTVDGEIMSSGRLGQRANATTPSSIAPITNTSNRIIPESIPQKGLLGRLADKFRSTPNKQGGFARITPDFDGVPNKKIELEFIEDVIENHPAKNLIKYMNKRTGKLPEVTGGVRSKFGNRGDDIVTELGYDDTSKLSDSIHEYKNLQAKAKQLRQDVTNERISKAEGTRNARIANQSLKYSAEGRPLALNARERSIVQSRDAMLNKVGTAEVKQVEKQTTRLPEVGRLDNGIKNPSFDRIVSQKTPLNKRIGFFDPIRTPENVIRQRLGMNAEMDFLRKGREGYMKEIKPNIEKITEWTKQVPKESNERIFQFLDGKTVDLNLKEAKVANEIKVWLKEWANRLNLPEESRVTNYITHLFDKELINKEFPEELARIISDKIPGEVYDPFLLKRLGAKGYKQDTWQALDAYAKRATRKVHMDPALEKFKEGSDSLEDSQWNYLKNYLDQVNMRPSPNDTRLDNSLKGFDFISKSLGSRPTAVISRVLRQTTFRGMIGGNVGSALRNLSQGVNTYAKLGEKYTLTGYRDVFTKGMKELKEVGVLDDSFVQDRVLSSTKKFMEKLDKGLFFFFDTAEKINRGSAYYGAKSKALAEGKTVEQAIEYAKNLVRETQFSYGAIDTPLLINGDISKVFFQFLTYPVKQTEFLAGMAKNKEYAGIIRYVLGGLAFTYTIGEVVNMNPTSLIPWYDNFRGNSTFGTPSSLKLPIEGAKALLDTKDEYGDDRDIKRKVSDIGKASIGPIPAGIQLKETYEGIKNIRDGGSYDKYGKLQFKQKDTLPAKAQSIIFGKYSGDNARDYSNKKPSEMEVTYKKIQDLFLSDKEDEGQYILNSLSDVQYDEYKKIKSSEKTKATNQGKTDILPIFLRVKKLEAQGKENEAQLIVDNLSDDEYRYYLLVKKQNK